jgi:hypothetical protein
LIQPLIASGFAGANDIIQSRLVRREMRTRHDGMIEVIHQRAAINEFSRAAEIVNAAAQIRVRTHATANVRFVKAIHGHDIVAPESHVATNDAALALIAKNDWKRQAQTFVRTGNAARNDQPSSEVLPG